MTVISLIGPPGSGKGLYGLMLTSRFFNTSFLSIGEILRQYAEKSANEGNGVRDILRSGLLMDDSFVNDIVLQKLDTIRNDYNGIIDANQFESKNYLVVLDGFPRNCAQTSLLSQWPISVQPALALHFDVPDNICISKLLGRRKCSICNRSFNVNGVNESGFFLPPILPTEGSCPTQCNWATDWKMRDDDTSETIRRRMIVYHEQTEPVLRFWHDHGKLLNFIPYNGVKDMDKMVTLLTTHVNISRTHEAI